ncbi:uncharacterized protein LOC134790925 [Cydia splendana]|uniref:uncharacterized protein LOC134790925 n=1 Tax=Cydia splendana TaxID=1100963 RepID=UPI00300C0A75
MGNKQLNKKKTSRKRQLGRFQQTMELTKRRKLDNFTAEHDTISLDYIELQNMEMESPISSTTDIQSNDEATGSNILNPRIAQVDEVDDTYRVPSILEEEDTHERDGKHTCPAEPRTRSPSPCAGRSSPTQVHVAVQALQRDDKHTCPAEPRTRSPSSCAGRSSPTQVHVAVQAL